MAPTRRSYRPRRTGPHEAALRGTKEETGLDVTLLSEPAGPEGDTVRPLPEPQQLLLEDIVVHRDHVAHQHIDSVFYGAAATREISPAPGEPLPTPGSGLWPRNYARTPSDTNRT